MDFTAIPHQLSSSPFLATGLLFLAGVLTSLTPCIYPMIPITAAIVGGQSVGESKPSRARVVLLTFSYVAGLAIVYASLQPFSGWLPPLPDTPFFLWAPWPRFNAPDVVINVLAYMPLGFAATWMGGRNTTVLRAAVRASIAVLLCCRASVVSNAVIFSNTGIITASRESRRASACAVWFTSSEVKPK